MAIQVLSPVFKVEECLAEIRECLEKGWTGMGFKTNELEKKWSEYTGLKYSHFLNSNTVGLHLSLHMFKEKYNWADGDEVITTPLTFISSNHAIAYCNLKPVFADVDSSLCISPESMLERITNKTKAIMYVGVGGRCGQLEKIQEICNQKGIIMILDAAHMAGTRINGQHVSPDADATIFSYQAVKNLPTADSGMICFKNEEDDLRARKLTWLGINKDTYSRTSSEKGSYKWMYDVDDIGFKYHGNSIMAAIGLVQLKYLDQDNAYRRQILSWYKENLKNVPEVTFVEDTGSCESATHLCQILVENRDDIITKLYEREIYPGVHYRDNTLYKPYAEAFGSCPSSHEYSNKLITLPIHLRLTKNDVDYVSKTLKSILGK